MYKLMKNKFRILALLILVLVLGAATYGFADANTFSEGDSYAGEGEGVVSGYDVTTVRYVLDSSDPREFASVSFTLDSSATSVYAGVGDGSTIAWTSCTNPSANNFNCIWTTTPSVSVRNTTALHVSSAQ